MERLNYFLKTTGQISPLQFGFTAGRSKADAIKTISDFVGHSRKQGLKCCLLALDIAEPFDNAWHPGILAQLRKLKCPPNMFNMVKDFLRDHTAHVTLRNSLSSKRVTKGCPQGSVSGTTLWNIIISDLIKLLSNEAKVKIVVFANDIMIMTQGPSLPDILKIMQTTLQTIDNWCKENRLKISKDKLALMPMFTRNKEVLKSHPTISKSGIKIVSQMKYLGVTLDYKMDWYPHTQYLENKVLHIRNSLVRCSTATWGMTFHKLRMIYKYTILPVITYASEAWSTSVSKRAKSKFQQIRRAFLIFITRAYKSFSNEALSAIAGIMPIEQAMQLYQDRRAISRGNPTNVVIAALKKIETPTKIRGIHPKDNHISVDLSGTAGNANMKIFTDGSKTENHVGASMVAEKDSKETHISTETEHDTYSIPS